MQTLQIEHLKVSAPSAEEPVEIGGAVERGAADGRRDRYLSGENADGITIFVS